MTKYSYKTKQENMMKIAIVLMTVIALTAIGQPVVSAESGNQDQTNQEQVAALMQEMLQQMHAMRQDMAKIHATEDANERHRLAHAHMESMRGAMMMMMDTMDTIDRRLLQDNTEDDACTLTRA